MKRDKYITWDQYYMGLAMLSALRSKDPVTQVGACIVNEDKKIIGIGYNGFPRGNNDDDMPWGKEGDYLNTKYPYVVHAELNAILNSTTKLEKSTIYVTHFPCNECSKAIIQSGIKKVYYYSNKYKEKDTTKASINMFNNAGIEYKHLDIDMQDIIIGFKE